MQETYQMSKAIFLTFVVREVTSDLIYRVV